MWPVKGCRTCDPDLGVADKSEMVDLVSDLCRKVEKADLWHDGCGYLAGAGLKKRCVSERLRKGLCGI